MEVFLCLLPTTQVIPERAHWHFHASNSASLFLSHKRKFNFSGATCRIRTQREFNLSALQGTQHHRVLALPTDVRGAWINKRGAVAGKTKISSLRGISRSFMTCWGSSAPHWAKMLMMPQFGKEHRQVYALKRQARPDKRSPITFIGTGLTQTSHGSFSLCICKSNTALVSTCH